MRAARAFLLLGSLGWGSVIHAVVRPPGVRGYKSCRTELISDLNDGHTPEDGHYFRVDRGLSEYDQELSHFDLKGSYEADPVYKHILKRDLAALGPGSVWLDAGTGDGTAIKNYLEQMQTRAKIYGLSFKVSEALAALAKKYPDRVKLYEGIFTDFTAKQLGTVDVITDNYGVISYAKDNDPRAGSGTHGVMQKYLDMLKVDGVLYVGGCEIFMDKKVRRGTRMERQTYFEWLAKQNIPGLEIKVNSYGGVRIVKRAADARLPEVEQASYEAHRPPRITLRPL